MEDEELDPIPTSVTSFSPSTQGIFSNNMEEERGAGCYQESATGDEIRHGQGR